MTASRFFSPAKINLFLDVLRRRPDGYHDLHTCFSAISLGDQLTFTAGGEAASPYSHRGAPRVELQVDGEFGMGIGSGPDNLVMRAVESLARHAAATGRDTFRLSHLSIRLSKTVPHGAGLGGGSSDAATTLAFLNGSLADPLTDEELEEVAGRIGSDCAFFVRSGMAEATGRGEILTSLPCRRRLYVLIVVPDFAISTKEAYGRLTADLLGARSDSEGLRRWLVDTEAPAPRLENTFELALDPLYPALPRVRERLLESGAYLARLSGSGSASFGLYADPQTRDAAAEALAPFGRAFTCEGPCGPAVQR